MTKAMEKEMVDLCDYGKMVAAKNLEKGMEKGMEKNQNIVLQIMMAYNNGSTFQELTEAGYDAQLAQSIIIQMDRYKNSGK